MSKTFALRNFAWSLGAGLVAVLTLTQHSQSADTDQEKGAANFRLADANSDNALSSSEFTAFIDLNAASNLGRAATIKKNRRYDTAFSRLDTNRDGFVTPDELSDLGN